MNVNSPAHPGSVLGGLGGETPSHGPASVLGKKLIFFKYFQSTSGGSLMNHHGGPGSVLGPGSILGPSSLVGPSSVLGPSSIMGHSNAPHS